jgi:hypothetical protein
MVENIFCHVPKNAYWIYDEQSIFNKKANGFLSLLQRTTKRFLLIRSILKTLIFNEMRVLLLSN